MGFLLLACDYDNTLAFAGRVPEPVMTQLEAIRQSGHRIVLVTGRTMSELREVCSRTDIFSLIVAENGAVLFEPESGKEKLLAEPIPPQFITSLRLSGVEPITVGRIICGTATSQREKVAQAITQSGLNLQIIFNKASLMILPVGVNKATGLQEALVHLGGAPASTIGVGDAENDVEFLQMCHISVAVANALEVVKSRSDIVLESQSEDDNGVAAFLERLRHDDLLAPTGVPLQLSRGDSSRR